MFDFETKNRYGITARTTDEGDLSFSKDFIIEVTNVNEGSINQAPTGLNLSSIQIAENEPMGTIIGTFSTTDPDSTDNHTYTISGTDASSFTINDNELQSAVVFDFETKNRYGITAVTTDVGGLSFSRDFIIEVTNVDEEPTALHNKTRRIKLYCIPTLLLIP